MNRLHTNDQLLNRYCEKVLYIVTSPHVAAGRVRLLSLEKNCEEIHEFDVLSGYIARGDYVVKPANAPAISAAMQDDKRYHNELTQALRWVNDIEERISRYGESTCAAIKSIQKQAIERIAQGAEVRVRSMATLYRWLNHSRQGHAPLVGDKNKGNRTPRYSPEITELVVKNTRELLATPDSRMTLRTLTELCNLHAASQGLIDSRKKISRKYIASVAYEHVTADLDGTRIAPHLRAAARSMAKKKLVVSNYLERVEQDSVHLPFHVITPVGVASNIYLNHAIECSSSIPLGWHLEVGQPNGSTGLKCVESMLFPKKERFAAVGLNIDIDPYRAPRCIVFDNGSETRNERMSNLVRLHIDTQYCKSRNPQQKPFIERFNRALKESLEGLPGCTRKDGKDGQRDPLACGDDLMTLHQCTRKNTSHARRFPG